VDKDNVTALRRGKQPSGEEASPRGNSLQWVVPRVVYTTDPRPVRVILTNVC